LGKEGEEIKLSIIGEKGATELDKFQESTRRLDNLDVARKMEKRGSEKRNIRITTGWERGADGKWRYEILDSEIDLSKLKKSKEGNYYSTLDYNLKLEDYPTLDDVLKNSNELFIAYPQLKNTKLLISIIDNIAAIIHRGSYSQKENAIKIFANNIQDANSTLLHEIQHAIQHIEGFSKGGNLNTASELYSLENYKLATAVQTLKSWKEYTPKDKADKERVDNEIKDQEEWINNQIKKVGKLMLSAEETYLKLAGEVEARNSQERVKFTQKHKRSLLLEETEDVARKDQIFIRNSLGEEQIKFSIQDYIEENKTEIFNQLESKGLLKKEGEC
jgi:hypothetical protein